MIAAVNWHSCFFLFFALLTVVSAAGVLFSSNVVRMAACLIVSLTGAAALFMLAGAEFVGAMQIMIYVGGTLVLLIFGVMLTAQATFVSMRTSAGEWILAAIVGGSLLFLLIATAVGIENWRTPNVEMSEVPSAATKTSAPLGLGLLGIRPDQTNQPEAVQGGVSGYLLPFEIVSVHLLVVLIGAAYLARTKKKVTTATEEGKFAR